MKRLFRVLFILIIIIFGLVYISSDYNLLDEIVDFVEVEIEKKRDLEEPIIQEDLDEDISIEEPVLTDDIENIKNEFYYALLNGENEIIYKPENLTVEELKKLDIQSVISENPDADLGYRGANFEYTYVEAYVKEIKFNIDYFQESAKNGENYARLSKNDLLLKREKLDKSVESFLSKYINSFMTDLEKEIAVHDYIVKNAEYNQKALSENIVSVDNYNAYGILVNGTGVCDGYAKAFYVLGKAAGLEIRYVSGTARNEAGIMPHAWNLINLDGDWYAVDATWNDPVFANGNKPRDYVSYDYFNVTDEMISTSHFRNPEYDHYPEARGSKYGRDALIEEGII